MRSSGSSCTGVSLRCRRLHRAGTTSTICCAMTTGTRSRVRPIPSGTKIRCAFPGARWPHTTRASGATGPTGTSRPSGKRASKTGTPTPGPESSPPPARATSCWSRSTTTAIACGPRASRTRTGRAGSRSATSLANSAKPCAARGCVSGSIIRVASTGLSTRPRCAPPRTFWLRSPAAITPPTPRPRPAS